ncbi:TPA: hypothetical protein DCZ79_01670 [Candidatus Nomurabacteria bacterium]|nr:hypothetical protein [Candidatus Nomurabacteria bacterium]
MEKLQKNQSADRARKDGLREHKSLSNTLDNCPKLNSPQRITPAIRKICVNRRVLKGKSVNLVKLNCLEIYILETF